uniref:UsHBZ protein n=1 Tax=Simian T-lymphotropic virus 1 TaxID=33747 RepID=A0A7R6QAW6_9STL1|nr:usHBZ protein [Simian T-lymphotropic virus 1]BBM28423.1 usHBZ protein [Simian T-lymphotropic virus 1]BBM28431.1 usHBZ protein [Simian T-lymphotropic virus 1]BBM28439.1 usHBZ protein [Simian T-lymphotropic virus 1]BBM28447.1 usHBZ protein [Simian T-lymphotropic virus 1]
MINFVCVGPFRCLPVPCPEDLLVDDLVDGLISLEEDLNKQRTEEESVLDGLLSLEEECYGQQQRVPLREETPPRGETYRDRQRRAEEKRKRKREREKEEEEQIAEFLRKKEEKKARRRRREEEKAAYRARRKREEEERLERKRRLAEQGAKRARQRDTRKEKIKELGVDGYARQLESEVDSLEAERKRLLQEKEDLMGEVNYWQGRLQAMWSQ